MDNRIKMRLIKAAKEKQTISYTELNLDCELGLDFQLIEDRNLIGEILGDISREEFKNNRPLLSILVRHKSGKFEQGDGFFKMCEELGFGSWEKLKYDKNFETLEIKKTFDYWRDNKK